MELGRLLTAMVTPFDDEGRVNYGQAKRSLRTHVGSARSPEHPAGPNRLEDAPTQSDHGADQQNICEVRKPLSRNQKR